jgi:hypothetical protein
LISQVNCDWIASNTGEGTAESYRWSQSSSAPYIHLHGQSQQSRLALELCLRRGFRWGERSGLLTSHRDDGKRFVARAYEKLPAFVELERAIHEFAVSLIS